MTQDRLIVTCDALPIPPLTGHNRKTHDLVRAISREVEVVLAGYAESEDSSEAMREYWRPSGVRCEFLQRRWRGRHLRSAWHRLSLPTVTRDFCGEAALVRREAAGGPVRVLADFLSGAPLVAHLPPGVMVSGHDCLSLLFREESRHASGFRTRLHFWMRRQFALTAERRFAHRASVFHVVSEQDAREMRRVNPQVRLVVIPIGGAEVTDVELAGAGGRRHRVIWGNLASQVIATGVRQLLAAVGGRPRALEGWTLVGRVAREQAGRQFPEMQALGMAYAERMEELEGGLAAVERLLLPDVSGTGQKNRTMDGLAYGCCVAGLDEVFRGLPPSSSEPFVRAASFPILLARLSAVTPEMASEMGVRARGYFAREFSFGAMRRRWLELLRSVEPLGGAEARP